MKKTVLVAGLGLIGGSLAKAITKAGENHVIGYDVNTDSLNFANSNGIIHQQRENFVKASLEADIIILAAPITETIKMMKTINETQLKKDVIVTDVSSVKGSVITAAKKFSNPHVTFIGGHPMAGSHKKGVQAAKAHLFENAIYCLTPITESEKDLAEIKVLKDVLEPANGKFIILNPDEHDEMTAVVSHFPHLIASSLVHQSKQWETTHAYLPQLAAGGFRDITRIASSSPEMWQDIFHHNRNKMSRLLEEWIEEMKHLKELVDYSDKEKMITYLRQAKVYRDGLPEKGKGAIPSFYDLYVDIKDQSGAIASVVQLLADENISIKNIEILEMREGIIGTMRLSFYSKEAQQKSTAYLEKYGYETMNP